jgi:hypothetical protein
VTDYSRVQKRGLPHVDYPLLVVDGDELAATQRKLTEATERKRRADRNLVADKPDRVKEAKNAQRALAAAEKAFETCWEQIRLTAMPPDEFEQLKSEHPPTPAQLKDDPDAGYNKDTFRPALLAACADGGKSADEWQHMLSTVFSTGEQQEIFTAALGINASTRMVESVVLPKGSNGMLSLLSSSR